MNTNEILLILDDGHGEDTAGKRTPKYADGTYIKENQFNKAVANLLGEKAKSMGLSVVFIAPEDADISLKLRTDRANLFYKQHKDKNPNASAVYISIHYNAQDEAWGGTTGGVETYFYPGSKNGEKLAASIQHHLIQGTPQRNRGVKSENFHVLRETHMPAALIEAGFMDHEIEAKLMLNVDFQKEVAEEILKGICEYFGVPCIEKAQLDKEKLLGYVQQAEEALKNIKDMVGGI